MTDDLKNSQQDTNGVAQGNEYNYISRLSEDSDFNEKSFSYSSENHSSNKSKRKGIKAVLLLIVLGGFAVGFAKGFQWLNETKKELEEYTGTPSKSVNSEIDENEIENISESAPVYEIQSLIELASRSDAKPLPDIVDDIMPSVVGVSSTFEYTQPSFSIWGWNTQPQVQQAKATGTGFIITEDGYIVTNAHVIYDDSDYNAGKAIDVSVLFSDETQHNAKIIAYDIETDIAVLKVNENNLKPAVLGNSEELRVGELVIAVGNPLGFDLFGSVTSGIVSALNREISINEKSMTLIQTDAAINSGNSGGPLLNSCGQVIGINSAKMSSSYGTASIEGLGFAIPIKEAKIIIDDLINYNYVKGRPQIGISTGDITEAYSRYLNKPMGVYVRTVQEGGAADQAGILQGDVIIGIAGEPIKTAEELNKIKSRYKAGDTIKLTLSRNGTDVDVNVKLQEANPYPDDETADKSNYGISNN